MGSNEEAVEVEFLALGCNMVATAMSEYLVRLYLFRFLALDIRSGIPDSTLSFMGMTGKPDIGAYSLVYACILIAEHRCSSRRLSLLYGKCLSVFQLCCIQICSDENATGAGAKYQ